MVKRTPLKSHAFINQPPSVGIMWWSPFSFTFGPKHKHLGFWEIINTVVCLERTVIHDTARIQIGQDAIFCVHTAHLHNCRVEWVFGLVFFESVGSLKRSPEVICSNARIRQPCDFNSPVGFYSVNTSCSARLQNKKAVTDSVKQGLHFTANA